jgi:hypothetical protein
MKAELVVMGKRIDMAPRVRRRMLVGLIYFMLAILMVCLWLLDRWRASGFFIFYATWLVNQWFLGGYYFGGLIKPFNGKGPRRRADPPPFQILTLHEYQPMPAKNEYRNDERELHQRDRAHYLAYQSMFFILSGFYLLVMLSGDFRFLARRPLLAYELFYGLVLVAIVIVNTLPQAILLWTEPDME